MTEATRKVDRGAPRDGPSPTPCADEGEPRAWECKCDPDAVWIAVWRIHTREQVRQKFAHLARRRGASRQRFAGSGNAGVLHSG